MSHGCSRRMMRFHLTVCKLARRFVFVTLRYPSFKPAFLSQIFHLITRSSSGKSNIDKESKSELAEYEAYSGGRYATGSLIIMGFFFICSMRNFIYILYAYTDFDNLRPETSLVPAILASCDNSSLHPSIASQQRQQQQQQQQAANSFACLVTNCSRLSASRVHHQDDQAEARLALAADLSRLPVFALCHPSYDLIMSPTARIDSSGMLILFATGYLVLLNGTLVGFVRYLCPSAHDETTMFLFAPRTSIQLTVARIRQLIVDLNVSYWNFRASKLVESIQLNGGSHRGGVGVGFRGPQWRSTRPFVVDGHLYHHHHHYHQQQHHVSFPQARINDDNSSSSKDAREEEEAKLVEDMIPSVRSHWWHRFIVRQFSIWILLGFGLLVSSILVTIYVVELKSTGMRQLLGEYTRTMHELGCSIWRSTSDPIGTPRANGRHHNRPTISLGLLQPIDLSQSVELDWTRWSLFETLLINFLPNYPAIIMWTAYYVIVCELACWLAELRLCMLATLTVSRYLDSTINETPSTLHPVRAKVGVPLATHWSGRTGGRHSLNLQQLPSFSLGEFAAEPPGSDVVGELGKRPPGPQPQLQLQLESPIDLATLKERFRDELAFKYLIAFVRKFPSCSTVNSINNKFNDSIEIRRILDELAPRARGKSSRAPQQQQVLKMANNQQQKMSLPTTTTTTQANNQFQTNRRLADQHQHQSQQLWDPNELCVETLEKIYINFRLFMHHTRSLSSLFTLISAVIYMFNYGLVLIAVFFSQRINSLSFIDPIVPLTFGFVQSNLFISLAANFHANTRKLQILVWSLIAQLTRSDHIRVKHIRSIWTKQLVALDLEGDGIALKAARIRITYVNIIQMLIWTGTILVIALKPN